MLTRIIAVVTLAFSLSLCVACASQDKGKVSQEEVQSARTTFQSLSLGEPKNEVISSFKHGNVVRLGSSRINGVAVEEWKIEAYHDDDWNKKRDLFVGFMYFANGTLVETSSSRVDYSDNPSIVGHWVGD